MTKVKYPSNLSAEFYKCSKTAWPNEEYAILLGKVLKTGDLEISRLYFPSDRIATQNPDNVLVKRNWFETAHEMAETLGLVLLGDIHSHCYDIPKGEEGPMPGSDPSEADWEWAFGMKHLTGGKYRVFGIVRVMRKDGRTGCRTRFWPAVDLPKIVK